MNRYRTIFLAASLLVVLSASVALQSSHAQTDEQPGLVALKKGDYTAAQQLINARLVSHPDDIASQRALLSVYYETGRYAEAEATAKRFLQKTPNTGIVRHELAEVLATTGRYNDAVTEFERASADENNPADKLKSDLRRAEVLESIGQDEKATSVFQSLINYYTAKDPQTAPELTSVARALVHLARYQDANDIYRSAIEADPTYIDAQLGAGELFTDKYSYGDAAQFYADALGINPNSARAQLGVARNKSIEGGEEMQAAVSRALAINSNLVEALTFNAGQLLEASQFLAAGSELEKAIKINPQSLQVHALRASILYLQDRDFEPEVSATLAINPRYGELYDTLAHYATITRRTEQAAVFSRHAIELEPRLWSAHLNLGMSLLRMGQMVEGRRELELAFKGDPFNVWAKNTLDLLDTMKEFRENKREPFVVKTAATESEVLSGYALNLLDEARQKLTAKYKFTPKGPITVEIFPNHEDFAVRTLGIPGLGALGVCFGQLIAQDSPSARDVGEINWGSTLWHEYTHVITLQMTDYRIPRWFSEGLSVYEERRARPGWGDDWNPLFVRSFAAGRWFKISDLDAGFMRPRAPQDLPIAYFEASQICEFIAERYGFDSILTMLALYRNKSQTADVLRQALKLSEADFDRQFNDYIGAKTASLQRALSTEANVAASLSKDEVLRLLATQDTFALHLRAAELLAADGDTGGAITHYKRAIELFPFVTGKGNPYESLSNLLERNGESAQAANTLDALVQKDENNIEALKTIARLRLTLGDKARAVDALNASFFISPFDASMHTQAGELNVELKRYEPALAEFQVALGLQPPNIAEANYNVANTYYSLGRQPEAKKAILRALEAAPRYEKAQELLLRITGQ